MGLWDELDPAAPATAMALERLRTQEVGWLTTVDRAGAPRSVPVWFYRHADLILIVSEPQTAKVRHIRAGSKVQLHLNSGAGGNEIVILDGTATVSPCPTADWMTEIEDGYRAKYAAAIENFGMPLEQITEQFSTVIEFVPTRLRAW